MEEEKAAEVDNWTRRIVASPAIEESCEDDGQNDVQRGRQLALVSFAVS